MTRLSVQGGYCGDYAGGCALEKTDCVNPGDFLSSREMQSSPGAHGGSCLWQDSIRETRLGRCSNGYCSPNAESCVQGGYDESPSNCVVENTKFGSCGGNRCAWSSDHCHDTEDWAFPSKDCSCDKVQVGGCRKGDGEVFCAVSPDACDDESEWLGVLKVKSEAGYDCFLCRETSVGGSGEGNQDGNGGGNQDGTGGGNGNRGKPTNQSSSGERSSSNTLTIFGSTVGAIAGLSLLVFAGLYMSKKRRKRSSQFGREEVAPPKEAPLGTIENYPGDDNGKLDEVSVL